MQKDSSTSQNIFVFGLGLVAGWCVKQLFDSPEFSQKRQALTTNADELRQRLMDSDEADRVKEIFGKVTEEFSDIYAQTKDSLISELSVLKVSLDDLDKDKYVDIVTKIVSDLRSDNRLSNEQVSALTTALTNDFSKLRRRRARLLAKK